MLNFFIVKKNKNYRWRLLAAVNFSLIAKAKLMRANCSTKTILGTIRKINSEKNIIAHQFLHIPWSLYIYHAILRKNNCTMILTHSFAVKY